MPNGLAINGGVTFPILAPDGSAAAPSYSFASETTLGLYRSSTANMTCAGNFNVTSSFGVLTGGALRFSGTSDPNASDVFLYRLAAASLRLGFNPSATPTAQTFTIGEASRPGTDVDVGGASGTIRSGLGTGTGTASSLIFQTPTVVASGSTVQTYTTRVTMNSGGVNLVPGYPVIFDYGAGSVSWAAGINNGVAFSGNGSSIVSAATTQVLVRLGLLLSTSTPIAWGDMNTLVMDTMVHRLAAASLRLGLEPNATPVAQTFTIGEASRPGTDTNIGGASGTIRSGLGTGTGTASSILFQTPTLVASGSTTQTYSTRLALTAAPAGSIAPGASLLQIGGTTSSFPALIDYTSVDTIPTVAVCLADGSALTRFRIGVVGYAQNWYAGSAALLAGGGYGGVLDGLALGSAAVISWDSNVAPTAGSPDLAIARLGAASLRQGKAPSATPAAQTFTIGEASRPGTDTNVGGSNATIRSGLGTGTGTASSLLFQTPTLVASGSTTQTYATRLTIATAGITATVPFLAVGGSNSAPGISFDGATNYGFYAVANGVVGAGGGNDYFWFGANPNGFCLLSQLLWESGAIGSSRDLALNRLAAATLRQGFAPSATPTAQIFVLGESSRGTTDNNVAGANGTIRCGAGTGNAAGASLIFQTPTATGAGSVAQSYATRLTLSELGATFDIPDQGLRINNQVNGAGASAGTLANAPSAGNPNFWLPINIAGTVRYFPGW